MSFSKISLKFSFSLAALALAGCGGNPPAAEGPAYSAPVASTSSSMAPAQSSYSEPQPYEPVLERDDDAGVR